MMLNAQRCRHENCSSLQPHLPNYQAYESQHVAYNPYKAPNLDMISPGLISLIKLSDSNLNTQT
jgi:hypothetical protein